MSNDARQFLGNVDRRSREARRVNDVLDGLLRHLGGAEAVSEVRLHLAKRASALVTYCEIEEAKLVLENTGNAPPFDPQLYSTAVNSLRRLLLDLGLNPALRDVTPDLSRYLSLLDDDVIDAERVTPEPVVSPEPPEPVRRDSRGRVLKGTAEQAERAAHMREVGMKRKLEKEAEQKLALAHALKAAQAAKKAAQSGDSVAAALDASQPAKKSYRAAKLPMQRVKRVV